MKKLVLLLLSIFLFTFLTIPGVSIATPVELVENGDFETGNFNGWEVSLNSQVVSSPVYEGNYAAALSLSEIDSRWGFTWDTNAFSAVLVQELDGFETTDQIFTGSLYYNVETLKDWGAGTDNVYFGYLAVNDSTMPPTFLGGGALIASGDTSGWQHFEATVDLSGETIDSLYVGIFFADGLLAGGSLDPSSAFVDNVSVTAAPVPEPTTILLSGLGLLGMGAYLRRRRRNK